MVDAQASDAKLTRMADSLERYRVRISLIQAIAVTFLTAGVAVAIPATVDWYRARLDQVKSSNDLQVRVLDMRNTYTSNFLSQGINQDIEIRIRLSEYFSNVADENWKTGWKSLHESLVKRRKEVRENIGNLELKIAALRSRLRSLSAEELAELEDLYRRLNWEYSELGPVTKDANLSLPKSEELELDTANIVGLDAALNEIEKYYRDGTISKDAERRMEGIISSISSRKQRYQRIAEKLQVPWPVVAISHAIRSKGNLDTNFDGRDPPDQMKNENDIEELIWEQLNQMSLTGYMNLIKKDQSISSILYTIDQISKDREHAVDNRYLFNCMIIPGRNFSRELFWGDSRDMCGSAPVLKQMISAKIFSLEDPMQ